MLKKHFYSVNTREGKDLQKKKNPKQLRNDNRTIHIDNYRKRRWIKMHQPKDTYWLGGCRHVHVCISTHDITLLGPTNGMWLFYAVRLMFPLWLTTVIILFFFWLLIVKTDKHLLLLWLCNYYSLNTTVSWLVNRKIIEFYITKSI